MPGLVRPLCGNAFPSLVQSSLSPCFRIKESTEALVSIYRPPAPLPQ